MLERLALTIMSVMRSYLRVAAASLLAATLVAVPFLGRRAAAESGGPVGGAPLGREGVVVHQEPGVPALPEVSARSYVVADATTGTVLAAKDAHGRYRPASTLKVLTAITLIPRLDRDEKVRPSPRAVRVEGSKVGLTTKMRYRVEDLFRGLLLSSGNDAALALAHAAGGLEHTVDLMNATADRLHAQDTVAKTPHGLDRPGQYSSAYDLALFFRAGLAMPAFRDYVGTVRAEFPAPDGTPYQIGNHNDLLTEYEGAVGGKTGYTSEAEATYVGAARRDGHTIIIALMHSDPRYWNDAEALLDWGFAAAGEVEPVGRLVEPGPHRDRDRPLARPAAKQRVAAGPGGANGAADGPIGDDRFAVVLAAVSALTLTGFALRPLRPRPEPRYRGRRRRQAAGRHSRSPSTTRRT